MKNLIYRDFEKLQSELASTDVMIRRDNKKMPYDRLVMVNAIGKFSSKQSDRSREISRAKAIRRKAKMIEEQAIAMEECDAFIEFVESQTI